METTRYAIKHDIIHTPGGFLVGAGLGSEYSEVTETPDGFRCDCFISKVSTDQQCEHIEAVKDSLDSSVFNQIEPISQARADFYLSQVSAIDQQISQNQESATAQRNQIDEWLAMQTENLERKKGYYTLSLENWMRINDSSTMKLVNGVLKLRQQQPEIEITNEADVLSDYRFVRLIPEKSAIDKSALRKHVLATGEEIPGVSVHLRDLKFSYATHFTNAGGQHGLG